MDEDAYANDDGGGQVHHARDGFVVLLGHGEGDGDRDDDDDRDGGGDQVNHPRASLVLLGHIVDCARVAVGRVEA